MSTAQHVYIAAETARTIGHDLPRVTVTVAAIYLCTRELVRLRSKNRIKLMSLLATIYREMECQCESSTAVNPGGERHQHQWMDRASIGVNST